MNNYQQGDIVYVNLNPTKGVETSKKRPCVIVSNNSYNRFLNTVIIAPISNSPKYQKELKYLKSPFFLPLPSNNKIKGTILLQHLRSIDPIVRTDNQSVGKLDDMTINQIKNVLLNFF